VLATLILAAPAAAQDNAPPAPAAQAPAAQAPAAPAAQDPQLNGYCPASYLLTGKAVKGSPEFKVTHKDKVYYAASAEAKKALESEPDRYLPQFGGLCTTSMGGEFSNFIYSDPTVFDVYNGKVYLFVSQRAMNVYLQDKDKYIKQAEIIYAGEHKPARPMPPPPSRDPNAPRPPNPVAEMIGQKMPALDLTLRDGSKTNTSSFREPATLLMFYASWCPACRNALPQMEELSKQPSVSGARIMCVSMDQLKESGASGPKARTRDEVLQQWPSLGLTMAQSFVDPNQAAGQLKIRSYPTLFLVDGTGKIVRAAAGATGLADGSLRSDIELLISGKPAATPAPQPGGPAPAGGATPEPGKSEAKPEGGKSEGPGSEGAKSGGGSDAPKEALALLGQTLPEAAFVSALDSSKVTFPAAANAAATVVFFFVTYDKFSTEALPMVNEWVKGYDGQPVLFYGVTQDIIRDYRSKLDQRIISREEVINHWKGMDLKFPMLFDPDKAGREKFLVKSFPTVFLINREGRIEHVYLGLRPIREGKLKEDIDRLIAGSPPAAAPQHAAGRG
jgi:peroxiredoxin/YHS domain-containing protein